MNFAKTLMYICEKFITKSAEVVMMCMYNVIISDVSCWYNAVCLQKEKWDKQTNQHN